MTRMERLLRFSGLVRTGLLVSLAVAPASARADWREAVPVLRVGLVTGANVAYRLAEAEPFRRYLEGKLAMPVDFTPAADYGALLDGLAGARLHYAVLSAASFAVAAAECDCVEPVAVPAMEDGATGFQALLIARSDGPVTDLAAAAGSRLAVAGADSVAGRLLPMEALAAEGKVPDRFFSEIVERPDPKAALRALIAGEADIAVSWDIGGSDGAIGRGVAADMIATGEVPPDALRVVWRSALVPFGPHVVLSSLPDELKGLIREALVAAGTEFPDAVDAIDRSGAMSFVPVTAAAYAPIADLVAAMKPAGQQ